MMSMSLYTDIIKTINSNKLKNCQNILVEKYPSVSTFTLGSILSNHVQKKMKANHGKHNVSDKKDHYYQRFIRAIEAKESPGIILRIAEEIEICPVLVARFIIESYLRAEDNKRIELEQEYRPKDEGPCEMSPSLLKSEVTRLLRDTTEIKDRNLAYEVYLCTVYDDHYGPVPDSIRNTIGVEYETILKIKLEEKKVWFSDETQLRNNGYDKTPDFKLEVPIAIEGRVINWIESKATFGDEETHQNYLNDQLNSYLNRFGPGMVIYWLGYVETLEKLTGSSIFISDHLPKVIQPIDPSALEAHRV